MGRPVSLAYGVLAYAVFLVVFLCAVAFVGDPGLVPKTVDRGGTASTGAALLVDAGLLVLFVLQPLLMGAWRPIPAVVWSVEGTADRGALEVLFRAGWAVVLLATFPIDHFELFGVKQVVAIRLEERDLVRFHGEACARYRERVPTILPLGRRKGGARPE